MKQEFYDAVANNPIIAAVKDEEGLVKCLKSSDISVVFVLYGGLISDKEDVMAALKAGAIAISSTNEKVWKM